MLTNDSGKRRIEKTRRIQIMTYRLLIAIMLLIAWPSLPTIAQETPLTGEEAAPGTTVVPADEDLTPETVRDMVSRLSDQEVRDLLLQRLDAVADENGAEADEGSIVAFLPTAAAGVGSAVAEAVLRIPTLWSGQLRSFGNFMAEREVQDVMRLIGTLLLAILIGLAAEWLVNRFAQSWRDEIQSKRAPDNLGEALRLLGLRLLLDVVGLVVFALVSRAVVTNLLPPGRDRDRPNRDDQSDHGAAADGGDVALFHCADAPRSAHRPYR